MRILILAQTPPPFHGQSIIFKCLSLADWDWCQKKLIRLNYSDTISEIGKISVKKVIRLFIIVLNVWKQRIRGKIDILFYPPTGFNKIPLYRDIITLILVRWCSKRIIYHFEAGGFGSLSNKLNTFQNYFALKAYKNPDAVIILSKSLEDEIKWINPRHIYIVSNGIQDQFKNKLIRSNNPKEINILTVGFLSETKGVLIALEVANLLKKKAYKFKWYFIGSWQSQKFKRKAQEILSVLDVHDVVSFPGSKHGEEKWKYYIEADIFCFPTFYENEAMPLVILEAMMMQLPIITTKWRAIPDIIDDNINGLLAPIKNPKVLAEAMEKLILSRDLRLRLGSSAREKYLKEFTIEKHLSKIESVFKEVAGLD